LSIYITYFAGHQVEHALFQQKNPMSPAWAFLQILHQCLLLPRHVPICHQFQYWARGHQWEMGIITGLHYFHVPPNTRQANRWKEDWEELELLGRGAFRSVVKAHNEINSHMYTVKKIHLRTNQSDTKIFHEGNALSRLSHHFITWYYMTWVETTEVITSGPSYGSETASDSHREGSMTSIPHSTEWCEKSDPFNINLSNLDDYGSSSSC
ncbi:hypothetical protein J3R83DRAFT_8846, partial [Lanmaoa asiatica]